MSIIYNLWPKGQVCAAQPRVNLEIRMMCGSARDDEAVRRIERDVQ